MLLFRCPGCAETHAVDVEVTPHHPSPWGWNGDLEHPTLTPSIRVRYGINSVCHSFVREGNIQFLGDCTHPLAGQTVALPVWNKGTVDGG